MIYYSRLFQLDKLKIIYGFVVQILSLIDIFMLESLYSRHGVQKFNSLWSSVERQ